MRTLAATNTITTRTADAKRSRRGVIQARGEVASQARMPAALPATVAAVAMHWAHMASG
jgi:hypothetical protein